MTESVLSGRPTQRPGESIDPGQRTKRPAAPAFATLSSPYFGILVAGFIGVMLISNITGTKGVLLFRFIHFTAGPFTMNGLVTDGAFYLFPAAYILGDVISEVYGFRVMRRLIIAGFGVLLFASLAFIITIHLPAAPFYTGQQAFETVAGVVPRFLIAGLAGYLCGEFLNSLVLVKMKQRSGERKLWARLLGSTVVGEFADTLVFCSIAAGALGISTWADFTNYTVIGFLWKTLVEILVMPITYRVTGALKRREPSYQEALRAIEAAERQDAALQPSQS
ncbi:hypothetical protein GCM10011575_16700 [Microlunatus endophyticus]|uniref:Probable queuosine precursor transporter n=1 Tax=Microlunatus endophyticus TaxID=1716077 RepID=A0A917W3B8_9ACTN|nr:queuosine precursor transporter [Microlunatus endophyticus]GGL58916.1 hypothetical protein GCM10011575_16700 [Microlunatus endophyticus]